LPEGVAGKVVHEHFFRLPRGPPLLPSVLEIADQFLLFRIHGDHRASSSQKVVGNRVDVLELRVPIRVRRALGALADGSEAIAELVQQAPDLRRTHLPTVPGHRRRELRFAFTRPTQRRHGIATGQRVHKLLEGFFDSRLHLHKALAARRPLFAIGR
jgi:hypothetical protein